MLADNVPSTRLSSTFDLVVAALYRTCGYGLPMAYSPTLRDLRGLNFATAYADDCPSAIVNVHQHWTPSTEDELVAPGSDPVRVVVGRTFDGIRDSTSPNALGSSL